MLGIRLTSIDAKLYPVPAVVIVTDEIEPDTERDTDIQDALQIEKVDCMHGEITDGDVKEEELRLKNEVIIFENHLKRLKCLLSNSFYMINTIGPGFDLNIFWSSIVENIAKPKRVEAFAIEISAQIEAAANRMIENVQNETELVMSQDGINIESIYAEDEANVVNEPDEANITDTDTPWIALAESVGVEVKQRDYKFINKFGDMVIIGYEEWVDQLDYYYYVTTICKSSNNVEDNVQPTNNVKKSLTMFEYCHVSVPFLCKDNFYQTVVKSVQQYNDTINVKKLYELPL